MLRGWDMTDIPTLAYTQLVRGDLFPWVAVRDAPEVTFGYHTLGGRYLVFFFYQSVADPAVQAALAAVGRHRAMFDDEPVLLLRHGSLRCGQSAGPRRRRFAGCSLHGR